MPEPILVVEYEPRYTERVRQALAPLPWDAQFARDGEEALRLLETLRPSLIVLSSVTPKVSTGELIRHIRRNPDLAVTPVLLTVSGYSGADPRGDAVKAGANDILPKPYTENDLAAKIRHILAPGDTGGFTSEEIFGEVLAEEPARAPQKVRNTATANVDDLLADTLSGVLPRRTSPGTARTPASEPRKVVTGNDLEQLLEQTLSGVDKRRVPQPSPAAEPTAAPEPTAPPPPRAAEPTIEAPVPVDEAPFAVEEPVQEAAAPAAAAKPEEDDPADGTRFGQYVLQERIAAGGMAEVWKARMRGVEGFQKTVAIKKILPHLSDNDDFIEMFVDEAKLAAQLSHNNIIHIYDLGKANNAYYIAMEYIDGHDLRSILRAADERGLPLPVETSLFIASKIAAALDYAHRKRDFDDKELGLVHRDVSPQNVLISYEGDIKLCDFGIAKAASKASQTQAGALKGKLQYMSPEQAWGRNLDGRSDVFALGIVLFEMLSGRKLFIGDTEMSVLEQVREARIPSVTELNDDVTPDIEAILLRALQKQPEDRYQSAGEMARDLDQILYGFRPTPTSADVAIYMHRLYDEDTHVFPAAAAPLPEASEPASRFESLTSPAILDITDVREAEPEPEPEPAVAPAAAIVSAAAAPATIASDPAPGSPFASAAPAPDRPKRKLGVLIAIAAVLLLAASAAAFYVFRPGGETQAQQASLTPAPAGPAIAAEPPPIVMPPVAAIEEQVVADLETDDQDAIDAEVQRRLAEAREQLEAQRRQQLADQQRQQLEETRRQQAAAEAAAAQRTPAPATPPPAVAAAPATQTAAPTTTVAENRQPATPPQQTPPAQTPPAQTPPATTTQVAEQPAAPAPARTQVGDLVAPGTAGLVAPEVVKMPQPSYPSMARARRLEGTVLLNVLVSETGQVMDVRVLRGISPDLGFTNSATEAVRSATFRPATKDGVRVKSYKTISVSFKL